MTKATKQSKPRVDRGHRYCMILELEDGDRRTLEGLVERYQKVLDAGKANKALVIRQLIRNGQKLLRLPPLRER